MTTDTLQAVATANHTQNISNHMQGFLVALESRQELGFYTPATSELAESILAYIGEDTLIETAETFEEDDDLMGGVNLVEPFYIEYFTSNVAAIKKYLGIITNEDECGDASYSFIYNLIETQCQSDFDISHVKTAFNSPINTTIDTLDDSNPYDDVYYFVAEFSSALVARSVCQAYTNYTLLELA